MTASLEALVEHWPGEHLLYVRALPGFMVAGEHLSELHRRSSAALQSHLDWLLERDLIDQPSGAIELNVVEEANATASAIGPRFMSDLIPPDAAEIESALAVGRAAVSDLIDAYEIASTNDSAESQAAALRRIAQHDDWCTSRLAGHVEHDTSSPP